MNNDSMVDAALRGFADRLADGVRRAFANVAQREAAGPRGRVRVRWGALAVLLGPALGVVAGVLLLTGLHQDTRWGAATLLVSALLLGLRLGLSRHPRLADAVQVGLAVLISVPLALDFHTWKTYTPAQVTISVWLASCALAALALLNQRPAPLRLGLPPFERLHRLDLLAVAVLTAAALALRLPLLETIPLGADPDEGTFGELLVNVTLGRTPDPFATGWATHPTLQFVLNSAYIHLFDRTFFAVRLPSALTGVLMVVAVYFLGRVGFGRRVGFMAGLLTVGADVTIHFSRLGINNISDGLFSSWVVAAWWIAGATGAPLAYLLGGAGLGLSQYYYFGGRTLPFVLGPMLIIWVLTDRQGVRRAWPLIAGGLALAFVIAEPLLGHFYRHPGSITEHLPRTPFLVHLEERAVREGTSPLLVLGQYVRDSVAVLTVLPDRGSFYHPPKPMLHPVWVPLFLLGLAFTMANWRRPFNVVLWIWMAVILTMGSVLITDPATFHRLLGVFPAALLLVAVGVESLLLVGAQAIRIPVRAWTGVSIGLAAGLALVGVHYYFAVYTPGVAYKTPVQEAVTIAALEFEQLKHTGNFIIVTREGVDAAGKIYHTPINYVSDGRFQGSRPGVFDALDRSKPTYVYVLPDRQAELDALRARFPVGETKEYRRSSDNALVMTRYTVPPQVPAPS